MKYGPNDPYVVTSENEVLVIIKIPKSLRYNSKEFFTPISLSSLSLSSRYIF